LPTSTIYRYSEAAETSTGNAVGIGVDSDDDRLYVNRSGTREPIAGDAVETVTATNAITAGEDGTTFFLSSGTEFTSTLPSPAAGLKFTFVVAAAPSGADYVVTTTTDLIHGMGVSSADAGGSADSTAGTLAATIEFVDGQAKVGDRVELTCDGTYWYAFAVMSDEDAITFTPAA